MRGVRWGCALVVLSLVASGCGGGNKGLHPVEGQVLLNDQPVQGAKVILQPATDVDALATNPAGTTDAEGKFQLNTHPHGAGAKPGDYVACVIIPPGASATVAGAPLAKLPSKYAARDTSGLTVTIKEDRNRLEPFKLTK